MSNAAILYHPDGYQTARQDLKGRHVAGESFLTGFIRHSGQAEFFCHAMNDEHGAEFGRFVERYAPGRPAWLIPLAAPENLANPGCLFIPGTNLEASAWQRRRVGQRQYSLCGVTHTLAESPDALGGLVSAPLQPWDALICTSEVGRSAIEAILLPYAEYLRDRFGATHIPMPRLPVIPLGIDTDRHCPKPELRWGERQSLGIAPEDVALLFIGRLASHAKAHPTPMYRALQMVAATVPHKLHLIMVGQFAHPGQKSAYIEGAQRCCPDVRVIFLDALPTDRLAAVRAAADIFTSLSDNIQETFGLTPVEALASGLPSVVSDWNGYRETIRHGIDGFRVPSWLPPSGTAIDLAEAYEFGIDDYDHHIGRVAQITAVDVAAAAESYRRLIMDADLRKKMGESAREHAVGRFDWRQIIPRYQSLWQELAELRRSHRENAAWRGDSPMQSPSNPLRPDPLQMFRSYPTACLTAQTRLVRTDHADLAELARETLNGALVGGLISPHEDLALALAAAAPPLGAPVEAILSLVPAERRMRLARSLVHLIKFDLLRA